MNGKSLKTKYINTGKLRVKLENVKDGDTLYIAQAGDDHLVLSTTDEITVNLQTAEVLPEITTEEITTENVEE